MSQPRSRLLLIIVLGIEAIVLGSIVFNRLGRPAPPRPPVALLVDTETAQHFEKLWTAADVSGQSNDWQTLGQAFAVYGFFPEASQCLARAAELDDRSADNLFWRGLVLNRLGQTTRSTRQLAPAAQLDPARVDECHYISARNHLRGNTPAAVADTERAEAELRKISPGHLAGQYLLSYLLVHSDRSSEAMPILNRLVADNADVHRLYQLRATAAEQLGDLDKARHDRELAERVPETIATDAVADQLGGRSHAFGLDNRIVRAGRLANPRNFDSVADELNKILNISYRPRVARLLASIELRRDRPGSAVKLLEQLIERDGATADTLIELGLAMQVAKQDAVRVQAVFEQALQYRLDPEICRLMTRFVKEQGDQPAVNRLEALRKHAEGLQAFRVNQLERAAGFFKQAAPVAHQRQAESYFFLGESLRHLGQRETALDAYRRCLQLRPHHGAAADAVDRYGNG